MEEVIVSDHNNDQVDEKKRDFIVLTASAVCGIGAVSAVWPLVNSLNPAADVLALSSTEVNLSPIVEGQAITVMWRGTPIFIRHRTQSEIAEARKEEDSVSLFPDHQFDRDRTKEGKEKWLVMVGVCTHLGCVPIGQKGEYGGWFCPCHGSHYDTSGRIRKGPAPTNMPIPPYEFVQENLIRIG
ncbi:MAG: ubiquinol-cytochrome c reductase iron-sulfur subunit [Pseudomonadota bacterium]